MTGSLRQTAPIAESGRSFAELVECAANCYVLYYSISGLCRQLVGSILPGQRLLRRGFYQMFGNSVQAESSRFRAKSRSTTILSVRHRDVVALGGDGQVTHGNTILKADTRKIRWMLDNKVLVGFAGSTADAFALMERFEAKLKDFPGNVPRAATELARDWRTDRVLRRLEAMMIVVDETHSLLITGQGDVVQPNDGIIGIGSGGQYAVAAARGLARHSELSATEIVRESLRLAAEIDIYTNDTIEVEELPCGN